MRLPRLRVSMRLCLLIVLVLASGLGWVARKAGTQRRAVAQIRRLGGAVIYDFQEMPGVPSQAREPRGPRWLRRLIGDELFQQVIEVDLSGLDLSGVDLACLEDFPELVRLELTCAEVGDAGMARLGRLKLKRLRVLGLTDTGITDAGLAHVGAFDQLTVLDVGSNPVTDSGLVHLRRLQTLRVLSLMYTSVTGPGLTHLEGLRRLKFVDLRGSVSSKTARAKLMKSVPGAQVLVGSSGPSVTVTVLRAPKRARRALPPRPVLDDAAKPDR